MTPTPSIVLDTKFGALRVEAGTTVDGVLWTVVYKQPWGRVPFLRIHSSCLFSESFGSLDCDCALQLQASLGIVAAEGGAVVYLYQEGRGLGLVSKIRAIQAEQEHLVETAEAYARLGFALDPRDYSAAIVALEAVCFPRELRMATNNPRKTSALQQAGYIVRERVALQLPLTERIRRYLKSKVRGLGHHEQD